MKSTSTRDRKDLNPQEKKAKVIDLELRANPVQMQVIMFDAHSNAQDEDEEYVEILPEQIKKARAKGPKQSVSAEAFGAWNKKEAFQARVIDKNQATIQSIKTRLNQSFLFNMLNEADLKIVVNAMEEKNYKPGDAVITQGEDGAELFVVENGILICSKVFLKDTKSTFLKKYGAGDSFGELALLYNVPRAATIVAETECKVWCLDRGTFNHIVKDASRQRRERYEGFLTQVEILEGMEPYERSKLSDAFVEESFSAGKYVIRSGEAGNKFYLVEEGTLVATKILQGQSRESEVMNYSAGSYFGERALLKGEPRAANVVAKTNCKLISLDRESFVRLLGPLEDLMKRNMDNYKK